MTNKFIESSGKGDIKGNILNIITECLLPYSVTRATVNANLDHAFHSFQSEMRAPFETFIRSSPKDMRQIFYQILLKHFLISINSDKDILAKDNFHQITDELENLLDI